MAAARFDASLADPAIRLRPKGSTGSRSAIAGRIAHGTAEPDEILVRATVDACLRAVTAAAREIDPSGTDGRIVELALGGAAGIVRALEIVEGARVRYRWVRGGLPYMEEVVTCRPLPGGFTEVRYERSMDPPSGVSERLRTAFVSSRLRGLGRRRLASVERLTEEPAPLRSSRPRIAAPASAAS